MPRPKLDIRLSAADRASLERVTRTGEHPAPVLTHARILLKADAGGPDAWPDDRIADALDICRMTVMRVRHTFAAEGLDAALHRKKPAGRQYRKLDGAAEAKLVALACSEAPAGQARWTMRLLADKLVEMEVVASIDPATVCRTLKKTTSSRGSSSSGSSRPRRVARS
jgi:hypothetical protein